MYVYMYCMCTVQYGTMSLRFRPKASWLLNRIVIGNGNLAENRRNFLNFHSGNGSSKYFSFRRPDTFRMNEARANELVLFFDVDMTLYPASSGIGALMTERITSYCMQVLGMTLEEAKEIQIRYHKDYGLTVRGLLKHHQVDAAHYDTFVDGGLPLDSMLKPDPKLYEVLAPWHPQLASHKKFAFTNAGIRHAERVISLLGLSDSHPKGPPCNIKYTSEDLSQAAVLCHSIPTTGFHSLFRAIIFTDYTDPHFSCKPEPEAFERAIQTAAAPLPNLTNGALRPIGTPPAHMTCVLIDDSRLNVEAALRLGWHAILVDETCQFEMDDNIEEASQPEMSRKNVIVVKLDTAWSERVYAIIKTVHDVPEALSALHLLIPL
jgi:pyrimidine and pyridine-specific 5'-nucleotidase